MFMHVKERLFKNMTKNKNIINLYNSTTRAQAIAQLAEVSLNANNSVMKSGAC